MKSLEELNAIRDKAKGQITLRLDEEGHKAGGAYRTHVLVCGGTGCTSSGSMQIIDKLKEEIEKNNLSNDVSVVMTGCHGLCALGPIMIVYPEGAFYSKIGRAHV